MKEFLFVIILIAIIAFGGYSLRKIVYLGEHYVVDAIIGFAYAVVVYLFVEFIFNNFIKIEKNVRKPFYEFDIKNFLRK